MQAFLNTSPPTFSRSSENRRPESRHHVQTVCLPSPVSRRPRPCRAPF
ncbi:hypothetical protein [Neisseria sicca]|nr:hypothetical protein [Neisseria sicca]